MKRIATLICGILIFVSTVPAQTDGKLFLPIATDKTVSLIFPFAIRHVDRGTADVLVQQVKDAENLLLVKAGSANFSPTNLSVVTADGQVYAFEVLYNNQPAWTVYHLRPITDAGAKDVVFTGDVMNARDLESYSKGVLDNPQRLRGMVDKQWDIICEVTGIYIKDNVLFFQFVLRNWSPIDYTIDFIRFSIRDKNKGKRTSSQELHLTPLYTAGDAGTVKANLENTIVFALDKVTIPDGKRFVIQVGEKNGGRHLQLKVSNRKLLQAVTLPAYR